MQICFMYQHASEITEISEAMSLGAGVISALLKNGVMLYNRKRIAKLLVDLQHIVDGRSLTSSKKYPMLIFTCYLQE